MKRALVATLGLTALATVTLAACGASPTGVEPGDGTVVVSTNPVGIPSTTTTLVDPAATTTLPGPVVVPPQGSSTPPTTAKPSPTTTVKPKPVTESVLNAVIAELSKAHARFMASQNYDRLGAEILGLNDRYKAYKLDVNIGNPFYTPEGGQLVRYTIRGQGLSTCARETSSEDIRLIEAPCNP